MNKRTSQRPRSSAFTLIELLTVIAIIAILMALLFPAISSVKDSARKAQAKSDVMQIVAAVKAYNTEYGKYPTLATSAPTTPGAAADSFVGDMQKVPACQYNNMALFNTLRNLTGDPNGSTHLTNPRQIVFFEGKAVTNPTAPKSGFLDNVTSGGGDSSKQGCFYDPWGTQYMVVLDTNYDNQIDVSTVYSDFPTGTGSPLTGVGAFSLGKDQTIGSPAQNISGMYKSGTNTSDDILSWQ